MSDDKSRKDRRDKNRSGNENFEVDQISEKMGVSKKEVLDAISSVGSDRKKIEELLTKNNNNRKKG